MPAYQHHFMPLAPPPSSGEECDAMETLGTLNYDTAAGETLIVRFLGTPHLGVQVIAVALPDAVKDHPNRDKWFSQIMETAVTAIRISYEPSMQPFHTGNGGFINMMYESDDPEPRYQFPLQWKHNADWRVDINNVLGVFAVISGPIKANVATLLAESQVPSMPPHYAVLSLVRAVELLWPNDRDRGDILTGRQDEFAALQISQRPFRNALPEIRNRCAHGQGRGRGEPQPFVGLGYNDTVLRPLKKLLYSIVARGLRDLHGIPIVEAAEMAPTAEPSALAGPVIL